MAVAVASARLRLKDKRKKEGRDEEGNGVIFDLWVVAEIPKTEFEPVTPSFIVIPTGAKRIKSAATPTNIFL